MTPNPIIHIRLSQELLAKVDRLAKTQYVSRTEFVRQSIVDRVRANTGSILPAADSINISLLTDQQLEEVAERVRQEKLARWRQRHRN